MACPGRARAAAEQRGSLERRIAGIPQVAGGEREIGAGRVPRDDDATTIDPQLVGVAVHPADRSEAVPRAAPGTDARAPGRSRRRSPASAARATGASAYRGCRPSRTSSRRRADRPPPAVGQQLAAGTGGAVGAVRPLDIHSLSAGNAGSSTVPGEACRGHQHPRRRDGGGRRTGPTSADPASIAAISGSRSMLPSSLMLASGANRPWPPGPRGVLRARFKRHPSRATHWQRAVPLPPISACEALRYTARPGRERVLRP